MKRLARISGSRLLVHLVVLFGVLTLACPLAAQQPVVDFNRDIRPILANSCYRCHGPDEENRQAGLRLDIEQRAKSRLQSGSLAIVPGNRRRSDSSPAG